MVETANDTTPKKIALCLSGGGYRAAGFHLGTLDYLDRLGLRDHVTILSTVSGGTFVGTSYVVSLAEKKPFESFFTNYYAYLRDSTYVESLLTLLGTERPDRPGKSRNLIQAAAELYASTFLGDGRGRPLLLGKILDADIPLMAIFNATNFYSGENFLFQKNPDVTGCAGTSFAHLSPEDVRNVRLGDIAAASSCFPGGFEPLAFPEDFVWPGETPVLQHYVLGQGETPPTVPLMDGGVEDNVGLGSVIRVISAGEDEPDLIIASDVDAKPVDLYKDFPLKPDAPSFLQRESRIGMTMGSLNRLLTAVLAFLALVMVGQGVSLWRDISGGSFRLAGLFSPLVTILLATVVAGEIIGVRRLFRRCLLDWFDEKMTPGARGSWEAFQRLTVGQAINMVKLRLSSLVAMTMNVFMRCICSLTYDILQTDPEFSQKIIKDMIYFVLDEKNNGYFNTYFSPQPSPRLMEVVGSVANMNSTLWWEKEFQLPCLVACGQISLCLSLFEHYRHGTEGGSEVQGLLERLQEDWEKLNDNPYALLEERYPHLKPFPSPSATAGASRQDVQPQR